MNFLKLLNQYIYIYIHTHTHTHTHTQSLHFTSFHLYIYQVSLELHKALNQQKPIESSRRVNSRIEKSFRSDYVNRKIN